MLNFNSPISDLNRVGKTTELQLKKLGLKTAGDLLFYLPFRYDDFSTSSTIANLKPGQVTNVTGTIDLIQNKRSVKRKMQITEALLRDDSAYLKVIWFNQGFLTKTLKIGDTISLSGKVVDNYGQLQMTAPNYEKVSFQGTIHTQGLIPNYHSTNSLSQKQIRFLIKQVLPLADRIEDWLPLEIRNNLNLIPLKEALQKIHFPKKDTDISLATRRIAFTELFLRQLKSQNIKKERQSLEAIPIAFQEKITKKFIEELPFSLTNDQKKSAWEILQDLNKTIPMSRLLEGDVGSGKTLVAIIALFNVALNNRQGALMVPTEILAKQHFLGLSKYLNDYNIKIALITSKQKEANFSFKKNSELITESDILIGTHSLIQEKIKIPRLSLAIIDEQHRFGVRQRHAIINDDKLSPHFLSMTATPIPRSLALAIYGDLDLSLISELPAGRIPIKTSIVNEKNRQFAYQQIANEIKKGYQLFVVCPLIDESDKLGIKSAKAEAERLQKDIFPEFKISLLHGKMKSKEKEEVMSDFAQQKSQILVATSVIEVGVDVPNATMIIIEGAERFGLAQLHQFRGRVGRGKIASFCYLMPSQENITNPKTIARLEALTTNNDGLSLSKIDLKLRGAGDLYGTTQSGFDETQINAFFDFETIKKARDEAKKIFDEDPDLEKHPAIKAKIGEWEKRTHLE